MTDARSRSEQRQDTPQRAVALHYKDTLELPSVVASGVGEIAKKIIALAEASGIPIREDAELSQLLSQIPAGQVIQPESFRLVAEIVSFLYLSDQEWRAKHSGLSPLLQQFVETAK